MLRQLRLVIAKDLRLLTRDRAALVFIGLAPIVVITVAGLSLANLYGADPSGQTAFELPIVDEDASELSRAIVDRLAAAPALHVVRVATRADAEAEVRERKHAGTALVIPSGTEKALRAGESTDLVLFSDPVKYLERVHVLLELGRVRATLAAEAGADARREAIRHGAALRSQLEQLASSLGAARASLEAAARDARLHRDESVGELQRAGDRARRALRERLTTQLAAARDTANASLDAQLEALRTPLRNWLDALAKSRVALEAWLADLQRLAGSHAADIPPPPPIPEPPPELAHLLANGAHVELPPARVPELPEAPRVELPPLPEFPALAIPTFDVPTPPQAPGELRIQEVGISGAAPTVNTFDQNVPGFSVTFLLLGMLLGVSLGLLDEQEWGTFDRLRSLPIGLASVLAGKLIARFVVGVAQLLLLFAVGRAAFGVSLGPQPWALLLPIAGIAFAGSAFGLLVAALAPSRDAVLPLGSAVAITMAAMGGCWWPIDLEPRWMRQLAQVFPTRWAMEAFNDLMMRHRPVSAAWIPTAVMLAYGALYLALGIALFRRRLARAG